jgi:hypothetical protein
MADEVSSHHKNVPPALPQDGLLNGVGYQPRLRWNYTVEVVNG